MGRSPPNRVPVHIKRLPICVEHCGGDSKNFSEQIQAYQHRIFKAVLRLLSVLQLKSDSETQLKTSKEAKEFHCCPVLLLVIDINQCPPPNRRTRVNYIAFLAYSLCTHSKRRINQAKNRMQGETHSERLKAKRFE